MDKKSLPEKHGSSLPNLTHFQFLVLSFIKGETSGAELREKLKSVGFTYEGPKFYQMMARLERDAYVEGHYDKEIIDGQIYRERSYVLLENGHQAIDRTVRFYRGLCKKIIDRK